MLKKHLTLKMFKKVFSTVLYSFRFILVVVYNQTYLRFSDLWFLISFISLNGVKKLVLSHTYANCNLIILFSTTIGAKQTKTCLLFFNSRKAYLRFAWSEKLRNYSRLTDAVRIGERACYDLIFVCEFSFSVLSLQKR